MPSVAEVFSDSSSLLFTFLIFLAATVLSLSVMLGMRARGAIKRRAAGIAEHSGQANEQRSLRSSSLRAVQRVLDYTSKHYVAMDKDAGEMKVLRRRMVQAGIYDARAIAYFFVARTALAMVTAAAAF